MGIAIRVLVAAAATGAASLLASCFAESQQQETHSPANHNNSLPEWVNNPPADHYVGVSDSCVSGNDIGEALAFLNALENRCHSRSQTILFLS